MARLKITYYFWLNAFTSMGAQVLDKELEVGNILVLGPHKADYKVTKIKEKDLNEYDVYVTYKEEETEKK